MDRKISNIYDHYRQGKTGRREFLRKLSLYAGGTATALALLPMLEKNYLKASVLRGDGPDRDRGLVNGPLTETSASPGMADNDPDLVTGFIEYPGETGDVRAYLARPKAGKKYPAVIVIHENRGLQPHIMDVNRRMAREGFLSLAPDALSPAGGTPEDEDITQALQMNRELDYDQAVKNFVAAVKYLETHPLSNGNVGCTGFCWGGAMTNQVAVNAPSLKAAVPYYGSVPPLERVPDIRASIMAHYASDDARINNGIPAFEEALKKAGKDYRIYIYEDTQHAFNNDTNADRYNPEAAKLAWERTVAFFREKLGP
ncbi:MAG: dienelactone hydrolase family protein [Bacteroidales bacterium]